MALDVYKDWLGIPEGPRPPDHYQLLRLAQFVDDPEKVRAHYRKLNAHVRRYATGQYLKQSQELLNELAKAMLCLTDAERKREYDVSLGRRFEEARDEFGRRPLDAVLCERGIVTPAQVQEATHYAEARGLSMRDAVIQLKYVDAETAQQALAEELGLSYVNLAEMTPDDSVLDKVPRNTVKRHTVLPLFVDEGVLLVACTDQPDPELEEEIQLRFGMPIRPVIATPLAINQGIAKYYAPGMRDEAAAEEVAATGKGTKKKPKPARRTKAKAKRTEAEQQQERLVAIIICCWAIIGSVLLDMFVIKPILFRASSWPFYVTLVLPPLAVWWTYRAYWK